MENNAESKVATRNIAGLISIYIVFGLGQAVNEFRTLFLSSQGLSATECGRVLAATSLLTIFTGPLASAIADKIRSRRIVYIIFCSAWLVSLIALILTGNYRIAGFALCAGIMPIINISNLITYNMMEASGVNASMMVPKLDFSVIRVGMSIGYCLINFAYTPLSKRFGVTMPFICTMVFVVVLLLLSGSLKTFETEPVRAVKEKKKLELSRLFKNYYLVTFLVLALILSLGSSTGPYLVYLMKEINMDTTLVGTASGIRVVGEIVIMISLTFIKRRISIPLLQAIAVTITLSQVVIYMTVKNPAVIMAALILGGVSSGIVLGTRAVYLRTLAPEGLDTLTITSYSSVHALGSMIMSLAGGIIIDKSGVFTLYRISVVFIVSWLVLYFALWIFGKYVLKKEPPMPMLRPFR